MPDQKPGVAGASAKLNAYWCSGPGLAKWATSAHPWTTLVSLLSEHMPPDQAKGLATEYYHRVFGDYPGSDTAHIRSGKPIRGKVVGRG